MEGEEADIFMLDNLARTRTGPLVLLVEMWLPAVLDAVLTRRTLLNCGWPGYKSGLRLRFEELGLELRWDLRLSSVVMLSERWRGCSFNRLVGVGERA